MINCRPDVKIRVPPVTTRVTYLLQNPIRLHTNLDSVIFSAPRTKVRSWPYKNTFFFFLNKMAFTTRHQPTNG